MKKTEDGGPGKLFLVCLEIQKFAADLCWGSCGKGIVGAIKHGPAYWIPCREKKCPHVDKELSEGKMKESEAGLPVGTEIILRKLSERGRGKGL